MASLLVSRAIRRHSAVGLTERKLSVLRELAKAWQAARSQYIVDYWHERYATRILKSPRSVREERRRLGWAPVELTVGHQQTALMSALGVLRGSWALALKGANSCVGTDRRLTDQERRWLRRVLRDGDLLQSCLDRRPTQVGEAWSATLDESRLALRLRRLIFRCRPPRPRPDGGLWLDVEGQRYRQFEREQDRHFRGSWIAITGQRAGPRICVPLAGSGLLLSTASGASAWPTVRVAVAQRVTFTFRVVMRPDPVTDGPDIGIDKGYRTLLTASSGAAETARSYGVASDMLIAEVALSDTERRAQRRRLAWHARAVRNSNPAKHKRIRRNNLGHERVARRGRRERARLRNEIDRGLNELFRSESPVKRIFAERLDIRARSLSRASNRRLGRWCSGYLQRRLAYKAGLNGVELRVVNAAYTSQTCPCCWFTSGSNRRQERFRCIQCGYTGSADAVAATNVLARGRDPAFSRFTPLGEVKRILDERWRSARSGRAWGSNGQALLIPDDDEGTILAGAANNWSASAEQSTSAKPDSPWEYGL